MTLRIDRPSMEVVEDSPDEESQPVKILEDNSSAIAAYAKNPTNHKYTIPHTSRPSITSSGNRWSSVLLNWKRLLLIMKKVLIP